MNVWCPSCSRLVRLDKDFCPGCGWDTSSQGALYFVSGRKNWGARTPVLCAGSILDEQFRITKEVGRGSFGVVYAARDLLLGREIALKVARLSMADDDSEANHLAKQARLSMEVEDHRHVLKVFGTRIITWEEDRLFIVSMELASGTLRDWLGQNVRSPHNRRNEGLLYAHQACLGLETLAQTGIIHGDIKPENIFLVNGRAKVGDLSLTDSAMGKGKDSLGDSCHPTASTPAYMAPEQFEPDRFGKPDERSWIYSMGIILSEIADEEGSRPFRGTPAELRSHHCSTIPEKPRGGDEEIAAVIAKCLSKEKKDRYQTTHELSQALAGLISQNREDREQENFREMTKIWDACRCADNVGDLGEAIRQLETLAEIAPGDCQVAEKLDEFLCRRQQAEERFDAIQRGWNTLGFRELLELLREALAAYPKSPVGRTLLAKMEMRANQLKKRTEQCYSVVNQRDWPMALEHIQAMLVLDPGDSRMRRTGDLIASALEDRVCKRKEAELALIQGEHDRALAIAACLDINMQETETAIWTLLKED